jgi:hypothetical protein
MIQVEMHTSVLLEKAAIAVKPTRIVILAYLHTRRMHAYIMRRVHAYMRARMTVVCETTHITIL